MPHVEHRSHKGLNNRAENSHVPLRKRERSLQGFRSPGSLQRFVSIFSAVRNLFVPPRSKRSALAIHWGQNNPYRPMERDKRSRACLPARSREETMHRGAA
jgi:putative transposase